MHFLLIAGLRNREKLIFHLIAVLQKGETCIFHLSTKVLHIASLRFLAVGVYQGNVFVSALVGVVTNKSSLTWNLQPHRTSGANFSHTILLQADHPAVIFI